MKQNKKNVDMNKLIIKELTEKDIKFTKKIIYLS